MNVEIGAEAVRAIPRKGIYKGDFRCSAGTVGQHTNIWDCFWPHKGSELKSTSIFSWSDKVWVSRRRAFNMSKGKSSGTLSTTSMTWSRIFSGMAESPPLRDDRLLPKLAFSKNKPGRRPGHTERQQDDRILLQLLGMAMSARNRRRRKKRRWRCDRMEKIQELHVKGHHC
jgi:hypothetical protein